MGTPSSERGMDGGLSSMNGGRWDIALHTTHALHTPHLALLQIGPFFGQHFGYTVQSVSGTYAASLPFNYQDTNTKPPLAYDYQTEGRVLYEESAVATDHFDQQLSYPLGASSKWLSALQLDLEDPCQGFTSSMPPSAYLKDTNDNSNVEDFFQTDAFSADAESDGSQGNMTCA
jgi:hypothetical protein